VLLAPHFSAPNATWLATNIPDLGNRYRGIQIKVMEEMNYRMYMPFSLYTVSKETSAVACCGPYIKILISLKFRRRWLVFQLPDILRNVDLLSPLFKIMKIYRKCHIKWNLVHQELVHVRILPTFITVRTSLMVWTGCSILLSVWNVFHLHTVAGVGWTSVIRGSQRLHTACWYWLNAYNEDYKKSSV
jgi:hypothetical protein